MMIDYYLRIYDNDVEALEVNLGLGFMQKLASVLDAPEWNCLVVKISNNLILFYVGTPQERAHTLFKVSSHGRLTSGVLMNLGFVLVQNIATSVNEYIVKNYLVFGEEEAYKYFTAKEYQRAFETIRVPCPERIKLRAMAEEGNLMVNFAGIHAAGRPLNEIRINPVINENGWIVVPDPVVPELFPEPDVEEDDGF